MKFICTKCGHEEDTSTRQPRCACGGLWRLEFTPPPFTLDGIDKDTWSMFRYRKFMALDGDAWKEITLGEGMTPIIPFNNDVWLKMDYFMPTLSFKDRGAAVLVAHAKAIGVDKVVQDSSGNAGNSVAAYCARAGIACDIYVPEGTSDKKITMIKAHGATVHVIPGSRDHCAEVCRETARRDGVYYANHVYNPFFYEGTKTYIYETFEQMHRIPEHIFVPVGNGTLFLGIVKGLEHLLLSGAISHMPQLYMVQSEHCQPLLDALNRGDNHITPGSVEPTLAEGIAIGKPMRHEEILSYAAKYHVKGVAIPEEAILPARAYLAKQGIYCEHTTAAVFAGYEAYCRKYGQLHDVLISMCGAGLKSDHD
jgi:threonine synthase